MAHPLSLKFITSSVCMRTLLLENPVKDYDNDNIPSSAIECRHYLTRLLETDCFTAVSEDILHNIVKLCPDKLTNRLLHALTPLYLQALNLQGCENVHLMGLVKTLEKCLHVHKLDLSNCAQFIHPVFVSFLQVAQIPLTTVILEDNASVTDEVIHALIQDLPGLSTLSISLCRNVTNNVFLVDEEQQNTRELTPTVLQDDVYTCNLAKVDISGCRQLETKALFHLVSLCGPKLTHLNISNTAVNCTCLLHLAGYSVPAIIDLLLTDDGLHIDKELKPIVQTYRELREIYIEMYGVDDVKSAKAGKKQPETNSPDEKGSGLRKVSDVKGDLVTDVSDVDVRIELTQSKIKNRVKPANEDISQRLGKLGVAEENIKTKNQESDELNVDETLNNTDQVKYGFNTKNVVNEEGRFVRTELNLKDKTDCEDQKKNELEDEETVSRNGLEVNELNTVEVVNKEEDQEREGDQEREVASAAESLERVEQSRQCRKRVHINNGEIVSVVCLEHGEECESDVEIDENGQIVNVPHMEIETIHMEGEREGKVVKKPTAISSEKLNFHYDVHLYKPKIVELKMQVINFVSRRPYLGQMCLKTFFEANQCLKSLSVTWKGLTLDFPKKVAHNLKELTHLDLEQCSFLQTEGVEAFGRYCHQLQSLNIRGVVFITDRALTPYLSNPNLVHLQLSESNITDITLFNIAKHLSETLTSLDLSYCGEITEKGINEICSTCSKLKKLWLVKLPVSDLTLRLLAETVDDLVEFSTQSDDFNSEITDVGVLAIANNFIYLTVLDISWYFVITNLSLSTILSNCCLLEEGIFKGLKLITISVFLPIISETEPQGNENSALSSDDLPMRSTVYAPSLRVLDLDYCDLVDDQLLQKVVNVCRGTLQATDYYGQNLVPS